METKNEVMMMEMMETKWRRWKWSDNDGDERWSDDDGDEIMETKRW
jgi:hypothetical protein